MATLQKFKHLATQCAVVAPSPTRSPVIHLRRRKTLRMFLSRRRLHLHSSSDSPLSDDDDRGDDDHDRPPEKTHRVRRKLKDLFVSSPPPLERGGREVGDGEERGLLSANDGGGVGGLTRTRRGVLNRPLTASFRCRLLRRAWRPVLVPIPE